MVVCLDGESNDHSTFSLVFYFLYVLTSYISMSNSRFPVCPRVSLPLAKTFTEGFIIIGTTHVYIKSVRIGSHRKTTTFPRLIVVFKHTEYLKDDV